MSYKTADVRQIRQECDALRNELQAYRRKLGSKCEALLILSKDLDQCRQQRDQFKLMAEQVQFRYQSLKRQLAGVESRTTELDALGYSQMKQQNLAQLLYEMREANKCLQFEVDDLKQKLNDALGDIKLLREQIARQRVGTTDEGLSPRHFPAHEREDLVRQLEEAEAQRAQLARDLAQVLDEKVEHETERDVYKNKYERLNAELNRILRGDEPRIVDIDAVVMDNRYLQERMQQMEEEKSIALATVSKYKSILERKKNRGILKLGQNRSGGMLISQKQVHQLLETRCCLAPSTQMLADLQSLASALLDTVNDKNVALSHQRKTNKILGSRISELEKKLHTLEQSGLWSVTERSVSLLSKLRQDCDEMRNLIPHHDSGASGESDGPVDTPSTPLTPTTPRDEGAGIMVMDVSLADLDLLPTKDVTRSDTAAGETSMQLPPQNNPTDNKTEQDNPPKCEADLSQLSSILQGSPVLLEESSPYLRLKSPLETMTPLVDVSTTDLSPKRAVTAQTQIMECVCDRSRSAQVAEKDALKSLPSPVRSSQQNKEFSTLEQNMKPISSHSETISQSKKTDGDNFVDNELLVDVTLSECSTKPEESKQSQLLVDLSEPVPADVFVPLCAARVESAAGESGKICTDRSLPLSVIPIEGAAGDTSVTTCLDSSVNNSKVPPPSLLTQAVSAPVVWSNVDDACQDDVTSSGDC